MGLTWQFVKTAVFAGIVLYSVTENVHTKYRDLSDPQKINFLAMETSRLSKEQLSQYHRTLAQDLDEKSHAAFMMQGYIAGEQRHRNGTQVFNAIEQARKDSLEKVLNGYSKTRDVYHGKGQ
jgi:hypothetical protein